MDFGETLLASLDLSFEWRMWSWWLPGGLQALFSLETLRLVMPALLELLRGRDKAPTAVGEPELAVLLRGSTPSCARPGPDFLCFS